MTDKTDNTDNQKNLPVDLEQVRQKKASEKGRKLKSAEQFLAISDAIDKKPWARLPEFPKEFKLIKHSDGTTEPIEVLEKGVIRFAKKEEIISSIVRYCNTELSEYPDYPYFDVEKSTKCFRYWMANSDPVPKPKAILWNNEEGLCFRRLPWDYDPDSVSIDACPLFNELFSRVSNAEALLAWIGSLFDEKSNIQQYAWIFGEGQNGKGALTRFLHRAMGDSYASLIAPSPGKDVSDFWLSDLVGKRLGVFNECENYNFVTGGLFKTITGGDPVPINKKFHATYTATLNCKYLFTSNQTPNVSSITADMRRAVYCEIKPITCQQDPTYEERLWQEGGAFLMECMGIYHHLCPNHGAIPTDDSLLKELAESNESEYEDLFNKHFAICKNSSVAGGDLRGVLRHEYSRESSRRAWLSWLKRAHGITKSRSAIGVKYHGMRKTTPVGFY